MRSWEEKERKRNGKKKVWNKNEVCNVGKNSRNCTEAQAINMIYFKYGPDKLLSNNVSIKGNWIPHFTKLSKPTSYPIWKAKDNFIPSHGHFKLCLPQSWLLYLKKKNK